MKYFLLPFILLLGSCAAMKKTTVHDLESGFYRAKIENSPQRVYALISDTTLRLYPVANNKPNSTSPLLSFSVVSMPDDSLAGTFVLKRTSFDFDITTVPLKFRFPAGGLPAQLNSSFNGAIYLGYRHDFFRFRDRTDPLGFRIREEHHFEIDFGPFAGIGAASVNPSTTSGRVNEEYDGLIWQKGFAAFIGSGSFSVGLGIGFDGLLNRHRHQWIYQEKPWVGLLVGLNLTN